MKYARTSSLPHHKKFVCLCDRKWDALAFISRSPFWFWTFCTSGKFVIRTNAITVSKLLIPFPLKKKIIIILRFSLKPIFVGLDFDGFHVDFCIQSLSIHNNYFSFHLGPPSNQTLFITLVLFPLLPKQWKSTGGLSDQLISKSLFCNFRTSSPLLNRML